MNGSSFLSEYKFGSGKILVLNTSPVLSWSDLPVKGIFPPLINKSVFYLASKNKEEERYFAGDVVNLNLANKSVGGIKIEKPGKSEEFISPEDIPQSGFLSYSNTDLTGVYKILSGNKIINEFSINHDPLESVTTSISNKEFENYLSSINFKGKYFSINKDENPVQVVLQARFGSELWKIFILAAIIAALIEMLVARNAKKEMTEV